MASTAMHLAIAKKIQNEGIIRDNSRYEIGQILPDAIAHNLRTHADSHFKVTICEGKKKMIDFSAFRKDFSKEILSDDLYLGYYFHLIQDALYRKFLYYDHGYRVSCPKDVEVLYHDYSVLNSYLIPRYELNYDFMVPNRFEMEKINSIYPFSLEDFILSIQKQLIPSADKSPAIFTESMADSYISQSADVCLKEYEALKSGTSCLIPSDYAWMLPPKE